MSTTPPDRDPLRRPDGMPWVGSRLLRTLILLPFDRLDERGARRRRQAFGQRGWLLSWHRGPGLGWTARLSSPAVTTTIERSALTRCAAADRAAAVHTRIIEIRGQLGTRPSPCTPLG